MASGPCSSAPDADDSASPERYAPDHPITKIPRILPHERVFPIQIGTELFKISGASLSSDAPSYFSQYFLCQIRTAERNGEDPGAALRTLYIDRDPVTFRDISQHLQGYHVKPRDGTHFVRLFADAQFYNLPKLMSQLYEESIFISIGHREFQIPRDVFSDPGNSPNFFSLGFAVFFAKPDDVFPGLARGDLIRPPSILPPSVPGRSADTFEELLHLLKGYPLRIRDDAHRQELLRDARYFHFKGLEQRLVPHRIEFNQLRGRDEIALRLENIQKSGIGVVPHNNDHRSSPDGGAAPDPHAAWVSYARPFVDAHPAELVLEIGAEATRVHFPPSQVPSHPGGSDEEARAEFFGDTRARVARLLEVIAAKLNLPPTTQPLGLLMGAGGAAAQPAAPGHSPLSEDLVRVAFGADAAVVLDGRPWERPAENLQREDVSSLDEGTLRKRRRTDDGASEARGAEAWTVRTGQWRLRIQGSKGGKSPVECVFVAVKIDAVSSELERNKARGFLGD